MSGLGHYFPIVVALVFLSSIVSVLFAVWHSKNPKIRKSFIALFFIGLLVVNLAPFPPLLPFSHLHKYTEPSSNPTTYYTIYVVDESGDELRYDGNAARPAGMLIKFGRGIATEYREPKAKSTAKYLLHRARTCQQHIENGRGTGHYLDFPPHALGYHWDGKTLAQYGDFVGLRVYYVEIWYTESGLDIEKRDRTLVATLTKHGKFIRNETQ